MRLTLVILAVRPVGPWFIGVSLLLLAILSRLHAGSLRAPAFWLGEAALGTAHLVVDWPLSDNHHYLLVYSLRAAYVAVFAIVLLGSEVPWARCSSL